MNGTSETDPRARRDLLVSGRIQWFGTALRLDDDDLDDDADEDDEFEDEDDGEDEDEEDDEDVPETWQVH